MSEWFYGKSVGFNLQYVLFMRLRPKHKRKHSCDGIILKTLWSAKTQGHTSDT